MKSCCTFPTSLQMSQDMAKKFKDSVYYSFFLRKKNV